MRPFTLPLVALLSVPLLCGMANDSLAADGPASKKSGTATSKSSTTTSLPAASSPAAQNGAPRGSTPSSTTTRTPSFIRARPTYGGSSRTAPVRPTQNTPGEADGPRLLKPSIDPSPSAPQDGAFGDDSSREYLPPDDERPRTFRDDDPADEAPSNAPSSRDAPDRDERPVPTYRDDPPIEIPRSQPGRSDIERSAPPIRREPFPADSGAPTLGPAQGRPFAIPHSAGTATAAPDVTRDFWIVSSRNCVQQGNQTAVACPLNYYRCDRGGRRLPGDENQFRQSIPPGTPVCIVVHGSFTDWATVCEDSCATTRWLRAAAPHLPLQVVFFSWPSDPTTVILPPVDVGIMGTRAEFNGMYLSQLVQRVPAESPVSLIGHSHGARAISSCLHLMGGGCVQGYKYPNPETIPHRVRAVFMAGAVDRHWLLPGDRYGRALPRAEGVLNVRNCQDFALGFYEWRRPFAGMALGRVGLSDDNRRQLGEQGNKVREMEVGRLLGAEHLWPSYIRRPEIAAATVPYVYFEGDLNEGRPPDPLPGSQAGPQPGSQLGPNDAALGAPSGQPFPDASQPSTQPYRAPSSTQPFQDDAPRTYRSDDTEGDAPFGAPSNEITRRPFSSSPNAAPNAGSSAATRRLTPAPDATRSHAGGSQPGSGGQIGGRAGAPAGYPNAANPYASQPNASQPNTSNRNPTNLLPWWPNNGWNGNGWNNSAWSGSGTRPATAPPSSGASPYPSAPRPNGVVAPTQPNGTSPFDTPIGVRPNLSTPSPNVGSPAAPGAATSPGAMPRPKSSNPATLLPPTTSVTPRIPSEGSLTPLAPGRPIIPNRSLDAGPPNAQEPDSTYPVQVDEPPAEAPRFKLPSIFRRRYPEAGRSSTTTGA